MATESQALIIDNSAIWRETLVDMLADFGLRCIEADSAAAALALLDAASNQIAQTEPDATPFELALVDVFLDQLTFGSLALGVIRELRQRFPKTRVIAVAERGLTIDERQQLRDLSVDALFEKPTLTLQELRQEVNAVIHSSPYRVFIAYRREDGQSYAAILHHLLNARLGQRSAFMDIYDIPGGATWNENIRRIIPECEAMIVIVGERWQTLADAHRGLTDHVREEIVLAGRGRTKIIPVCIENAKMTEPSDPHDDWFAPVRRLEALTFPELRYDRTVMDGILQDLGIGEGPAQ